MRRRCLDCGVLVGAESLARCRRCNGRLKRRQYRVKRGKRAAVLAVCAKAARRLVKKLEVNQYEHVAGQQG